MDWQEHIELNPDVLAGKPVVRGTRIPVDLVLELLAEGATEDELLADYPTLSSQDILACLQYAAEAVRSERVYRIAAP